MWVGDCVTTAKLSFDVCGDGAKYDGLCDRRYFSVVYLCWP